MKHFVRDYFTFSQREKRGLAVLIVIIFLLVLTLVLQHKFIRPKPTPDFSSFEKEIEKITSVQNDSTVESEITLSTNPEKLFPFNPNTISTEEWKMLGLSEKTINTIQKYKNKGGVFFAKEDLKKIYGLSNTDYKRIEPYIKLSNPKPETPKHETFTPTIIEINSADSIQLTSLKGIGPVFAGRILKYRNLLGGFHQKEQLLEVYGFTDEMFKNIIQQIEVDVNKIQKTNINTADINQLKKHPYIKFNNAKLIINYRKANGNYKQIADVKKIHLITDSIFEKISPYLTTE